MHFGDAERVCDPVTVMMVVKVSVKERGDSCGFESLIRCVWLQICSVATPETILSHSRLGWTGLWTGLSMALSVFPAAGARGLAGVSCLKAWKARIRRMISINSCWGNPKI